MAEAAPKRIKLSDGVSPAPLSGLPDDPKTWTVDQVCQWALEAGALKPEHADKLRTEEITGAALHLMTRVDFERCGIPIGPAALLREAIERMFPPSSTRPTPPAATISPGNIPHIYCLISNPDDLTRHFLAEVILDSACTVNMISSQRKLEQLGIKQVAAGPGEDVTVGGNISQAIFPYHPVRITIPLAQPTSSLSEEDILALPDSHKKVGTISPWAFWTRTYVTAGSLLPPPATVPKKISPVKQGHDRETSELVSGGVRFGS